MSVQEFINITLFKTVTNKINKFLVSELVE